MATYNASAVSNAAIAHQKPITLQQGRALRDNPLAVFEGDGTAPRIAALALQGDNNGLAVVAVTASDAVTIAGGHSPSFPGGSVIIRYTIRSYTGTMRFRIDFRSFTNGVNTEIGLYRNGSQVQAFNTSSNIFGSVSRDNAVAVSDVFEWRENSGSADTSNRIVRASDGYVAYVPMILDSLKP